MVATNRAVKVAIEDPQGRRLFFRPIGATVRGRVDFSGARTTSGFKLQQLWPEPVPGQVVCVDFETGEKWIEEPLHEQAHLHVRRRIEDRGFQIPPQRQDYDSETTETWAFWLHRAIANGQARVVEGDLPPLEAVEHAAKRNFITATVESKDSRLTNALAALASAIQSSTKINEAILEKLARKA